MDRIAPVQVSLQGWLILPVVSQHSVTRKAPSRPLLETSVRVELI